MLHLKTPSDLLHLLVSFSTSFNFVLIFTIKDLAQNLSICLYEVVQAVVECSKLLFGRCPPFMYSDLCGLEAPNWQQIGEGTMLV